jgi:hypothetical protein
MKLIALFLLSLLCFVGCDEKPENLLATSSDETVQTPSETAIEVSVHARVDTTDRDVKSIVALWTDYLKSTPDEISERPYWNEAEKALYADVDLSRPFLYQFPSEQLLRYYKPKILSIEKEGDAYAIKTIFAAAESETNSSNPWCITKLYAVREKGEWKLKNALPVITKNWERTKVGKITFIYPPHHAFNRELAEKAVQFCNQISEEFRFSDWEPFDFYITHSGDELGRLLNFDFFFAGYTTGVGLNDKRILISGMGSEYYPHEFVHMIVPKRERHPMIEEGIATWKGGTGGDDFDVCAERLASELMLNDTVTYADILHKQWGWQVAAFYTTGGILCQAAYEKGGLEALNLLLETPNDEAILLENICSVFEIERGEVDAFLKSEVQKYLEE